MDNDNFTWHKNSIPKYGGTYMTQCRHKNGKNLVLVGDFYENRYDGKSYDSCWDFEFLAEGIKRSDIEVIAWSEIDGLNFGYV